MKILKRLLFIIGIFFLIIYFSISLLIDLALIIPFYVATGKLGGYVSSFGLNYIVPRILDLGE